MALLIEFEPDSHDRFDNERCRVKVSANDFKGEARFRNASPAELKPLLLDVSSYPIVGEVEHTLFEEGLSVAIEPIDNLGDLRLTLRLVDDLGLNRIELETRTSYAGLESFARELKALIKADTGRAEL